MFNTTPTVYLQEEHGRQGEPEMTTVLEAKLPYRLLLSSKFTICFFGERCPGTVGGICWGSSAGPCLHHLGQQNTLYRGQRSAAQFQKKSICR